MSGKQEADMMGQFPNVSNKQVTLANWRTAPFNQWAFQHVREIVPSANIPNDASQIQNPYREDHDFSSMEIKLVGQRPLTYDEFLKKTGTDGLVILKNGKIIEERYFHGMERNTPHILMSVSKSILGLVTGILIEQKIFIDSDKVCAIIPELGSTAYKEATIRDLLDMRTGVAFVEDYHATSGLMIDYRKATNWNPLEGNEIPSDLRSFYGLLNKKTMQMGNSSIMFRRIAIY